MANPPAKTESAETTPPPAAQTQKPPVTPAKGKPAKLRFDGPTLAEWKARGYKEADYPPEGYAALTEEQAVAYRGAVDTITAKIASGTLEAAAKFYHFDGANHRTFASGGIQIQPELYELVGGRWMGVYRAVSQKEIEALDALVKNPKSGVTPLTYKEWKTAQKAREEAKRGMSSDSLLKQSVSEVVVPGAPIQTQPQAEDATPVAESATDALETGAVV